MHHDELKRRIAERAYHFFVQRGHRHGHDREDWLRAEREVMHELSCIQAEQQRQAKSEPAPKAEPLAEEKPKATKTRKTTAEKSAPTKKRASTKKKAE